MKPFWFWFCGAVMYTLNWVPGYSRYYILEPYEGELDDIAWIKRPSWQWEWHAQWGFRLLAHMDILGDYADEVAYREEQRAVAGGSAVSAPPHEHRWEREDRQGQCDCGQCHLEDPRGLSCTGCDLQLLPEYDGFDLLYEAAPW
jgi:hypothetical protein